VAIALVATLALAGCGGSGGGSAARSPYTNASLAGGQCFGALSQRQIDYTRLEDFGSSGGCGIDMAIELNASTASLSRPATLGCPLAVALNDFERQVLQPMAQRHFGQHVARIHHFGAYACRARSGNAGRLSEHAKGRAIDVSGFELADGTVIRVKDDWRNSGARSQFLHEVSRGACDIFQVVLSPNHDSAHHDHLHFDIGRWRLCDA
jgi:hypothetical protein